MIILANIFDKVEILLLLIIGMTTLLWGDINKFDYGFIWVCLMIYLVTEDIKRQ